jgi:plastocyanin
MTMSRWLTLAALTMTASCSGSSTGYGGNPPPPPPPPPSGGHATTITVSNNQFSPTPDTINAGTITFHWTASAITHNVTWTGSGTLPANSGDKMGGDADYQALLGTGTYTYHCTHHAAMTGQIVVLP